MEAEPGIRRKGGEKLRGGKERVAESDGRRDREGEGGGEQERGYFSPWSFLFRIMCMQGSAQEQCGF